MARPKEFDPDQALQNAMEVFHRKGYSATSMQDLVAHMGIGRASLYETFGSKKELFEKALGQYASANFECLRVRFEEAEDPLAEIRSFFKEMVRAHEGNETRCGCLVVNTMVELGPHDAKLANFLADQSSGIEEALTRALRRAQKMGDLPSDCKPRAIARFLVNTMQGLAVQAKVEPNRARMQDIVEVALATLH